MKCCLKTGFVAFLEEGGGQCDQMIKLFLYLAIYSNKNLPQNLHKFVPKRVQYFAKYQINL